jgi:RNA polymerase sigma-70 factor (ECF subfamily)
MPDIHSNGLIERLRKGEKSALEEFYAIYSPVLLSVSLRYLPSREDAEDIMHEALLKILRALDKFDPRFSGSFEAWMRRITVNASLNYLRSLHPHQPLNGWNKDGFTDEETDDEESAGLPMQMDPEIVIRLIGELPDGYRTVLNMYVFDNYSHKDIARALGIAENTSKSQLSKARALLKKKVLAFCNLNQVVKR